MATNYRHGVYIYENPTSLLPPVNVDSAVQVAVGVGCVNNSLAEDVLEPQIAYSYSEAVDKMGMANDLMNYPLCQVTKASFELYGIAPVIYINVLDPTIHKKQVNSDVVSMILENAIIEKDGVLLKSLVVKNEDGTVTYDENVDYTIKIGASNFPIITALTDGDITNDSVLSLDYEQLDPSMVTEDDVLAGIQKIDEVYPRFATIPGQIISPGWSHKPGVAMALTGKTRFLNGCFRSFVWLDVDTEKANRYDKVYELKNKDNMVDEMSAVLWPCLKVGNDIFYYSALAGAHQALIDYQNESVPYESPSNKNLKVSGICLKDGTEIILDYERANMLNGQGICTATNLNGWKFWGNNTAIYPGSTDVKDRFIPIRRMFTWWGNTFILTYFQKVDSPMNRRLIETIIDSENIRANGFVGSGKIADAKIILDPSLTAVDLIDGRIKFLQYLTPFPPAEEIVNTLEFDPQALYDSVTGGID